MENKVANIDFKNDELKIKFLTWHQSLDHNKGLRAKLRRAKSIDEVLYVPQVYSASLQAFGCKMQAANGEQLAAVLGLAAHIKKHEAGGLAKKMAQASRGLDSAPKLSLARFQSLLQKNRREAYVDLIRVLRLLNGECDLFDISADVYYWGPWVKKRWAMDYFSEVVI